MDATRFDILTRHIGARSRRSLLGLLGTLALDPVLGHEPLETVAKHKKKPKKPCPPCQRRTKGTCQPLRDGTGCGKCRACQGGKCRAQCAADDCVPSGNTFVCLKTCAAACDLCHSCDRLTGQCTAICDAAFCTTKGCRIPCDPACGPCQVCQRGACLDLCDTDEAHYTCVDGLCPIPCSPSCGSEQQCVAGQCFPRCDPPCATHEGCVATAQGNACVALAGTCPANPQGCGLEGPACQRSGRAGHCVQTQDGAYCASTTGCSACTTDLDCQNWGFSPNSRCVPECAICNANGGSACVDIGIGG
jgi:hypothetical protein